MEVKLESRGDETSTAALSFGWRAVGGYGSHDSKSYETFALATLDRDF